MTNRGFSLVEVLIAVLIAAFLLAAVWTSFLHGSFNVNSARHAAQAMDLCEAGLELMEGKTQAQLSGLNGYAITVPLNLDYSDDRSAAIRCTRTTAVSDNDGDNVYEITVTVSWTERLLGGTKARQVTLQTQIAKLNM
jgi:prepilin-type N-terminal cleavage/methylation domain-containing protein